MDRIKLTSERPLYVDPLVTLVNLALNRSIKFYPRFLFLLPLMHLFSSRRQALIQFISPKHSTIHSKAVSIHLSVQIRFNSGTLKIFFCRFFINKMTFKTYGHSVRRSTLFGSSFWITWPESRSKCWHSTRAKSGINLWKIIFWCKISQFSNLSASTDVNFPWSIFEIKITINTNSDILIVMWIHKMLRK